MLGALKLFELALWVVSQVIGDSGGDPFPDAPTCGGLGGGVVAVGGDGQVGGAIIFSRCKAICRYI